MIGNILSGVNLCNEDRVLILLIKYGRISSREFKITHKVKNINVAIKNLRKKDFVICSETITDELESGKRVRGTIYYLAPKKYQNNKINIIIEKFVEEQKRQCSQKPICIREEELEKQFDEAVKAVSLSDEHIE